MKDSILDITVSTFRDYNTPSDPQPVNLLAWLNSKKYINSVIAIRSEKDKAVRDSIKSTLPAITSSGIFTYRSARCLVKHSGFIQFDIDLKENCHMTNYSELKAEICKIVNVAYCGLSVSGTGFWGLIPIAFPDKHTAHFDFIYNAFSNLGILIDKKPRNVAALRGYSYDSDAYFNHSAKKLEEYYRPPVRANKGTLYSNNGYSTQSQVETLINQVTHKGIDLTGTYDDWLSLAFAFANEFGEGGRQYFHDVSNNYSSYDTTETDLQYTKCLKSGSSSKPITIKSFFAKCKNAGVLLPKTENKSENKTERFKIKSKQDQIINHISSANISSLGKVHTETVEAGGGLSVTNGGELIINEYGYPAIWDQHFHQSF